MMMGRIEELRTVIVKYKSHKSKMEQMRVWAEESAKLYWAI